MIGVLHITSLLSNKGGGVMECVSALTNALGETSTCDVSIAGGGAPLSQSERGRYNSSNLTECRESRIGPLIWSELLSERMRAGDFDLIHAHTVWGLVTRTLKKEAPVQPYLLSAHGMLDDWVMQQDKLKRFIAWQSWVKRSLEDATCIHALCEPEHNSIRALGLDNPIATIPNGVTIPELSPYNPEGPIVFLGRIHPKKGLLQLLNSWQEVDHPLVIAGWDDGGHIDELHKYHSQLGLKNKVTLLGPVFGQEKEDLLRSASALILPSFSEGLPMAVLEAWSFGLPVIKSNNCNLPGGFSAGAAIEIEPNADSIRSGVTHFRDLRPEEREDMGRSGLNLAKTQFNWEAIAENFLELYAWMLNRAEAPQFVSEA